MADPRLLKGEDGWRREMENKEQLRQKSERGEVKNGAKR